METSTGQEQVPLVLLGAFAGVPWVNFGVVPVKFDPAKPTRLVKTFRIQNATEKEIEVTPEAAGMRDVALSCGIDPFVVPSLSSLDCTVTWTPPAAGALRQRIVFKFGKGRNTTLMIDGECKEGVSRKGSARMLRAPAFPLAETTNTADASVATRAALIPCTVSPALTSDPSPGSVDPPALRRQRRDSDASVSSVLSGSSTVSVSSAGVMSAGIGPSAGRPPPNAALAPRSVPAGISHVLPRAQSFITDVPVTIHVPEDGIRTAHGTGVRGRDLVVQSLVDPSSRASSPSKAPIPLTEQELAAADTACHARAPLPPPPAFLLRMQQRKAAMEAKRCLTTAAVVEDGPKKAHKQRAASHGAKSRTAAPVADVSHDNIADGARDSARSASWGPQAEGQAQVSAVTNEFVKASAGMRGGVAMSVGNRRRARAGAGLGIRGMASPTVEIYTAPMRSVLPPVAEYDGSSSALAASTASHGGMRMHALVPMPTPIAAPTPAGAFLLNISPVYAHGRHRGTSRPPIPIPSSSQSHACMMKALGLTVPMPKPTMEPTAGVQGTPAHAQAFLLSPAAKAAAGLLSPRQAAKLMYGFTRLRQPSSGPESPELNAEELARGVCMAMDGQGLGKKARLPTFRFSKAAAERRAKTSGSGQARASSTVPTTTPAFSDGLSVKAKGGAAGRAAPKCAPLMVPVGSGTATGPREEALLSSWLNTLLAPASSHCGGAQVTAHAPGGAMLAKDASVKAIRAAADNYKRAADKLSGQARLFGLSQDKSVRMQGLKLHISGHMAAAAESLKAEIKARKLSARGDVSPHTDSALRSRLVSLLVTTYHPSWLALGLEIVFGTPSLQAALAEAKEKEEASARQAVVERLKMKEAVTVSDAAAAAAPAAVAAAQKVLRRSSSAYTGIGRGRSLEPKPNVVEPKRMRRAGSMPAIPALPAGSAGPHEHPTVITTCEASGAAQTAIIKKFLHSCFLVDRGAQRSALKKRFGLASPEHLEAQQCTLLHRMLTLLLFLDCARTGAHTANGTTSAPTAQAVAGLSPAKQSEGAAILAAAKSLLASAPIVPVGTLNMRDFAVISSQSVAAQSAAEDTIAQAKGSIIAGACSVVDAISRLNLPPCLFLPSSDHKASRDVVLAFAKDVLKAEGDILRHLAGCGLVFTFVQNKLDEHAANPNAWVINDLGVDLRDGVRMIRLAEVLSGAQRLQLARTSLRFPAATRTNKLHNVTAALDFMHRTLGLDCSGTQQRKTVVSATMRIAGVKASDSRKSFGRAGPVTRVRLTGSTSTGGRQSIIITRGKGKKAAVAKGPSKLNTAVAQESAHVRTLVAVRPADIVDGQYERTVALLWALVDMHAVSGSPSAPLSAGLGVDIRVLEAETARLCTCSTAAVAALFPPKDGTAYVCGSEGEKALLRWVQAAVGAAAQGAGLTLHVTSWTCPEMADGRALALLMAKYQPRLLPRKAIALKTSMALMQTKQSQPGQLLFRPGVTLSDAQAAFANERVNFRLVSSAASALGCGSVPLGGCDSAHRPDARVMRIVAAALARRLLESTSEGKAARTVQRWLRKTSARNAEVLKGKTKKARHTMGAIKLQTWYRKLLPLVGQRRRSRAAVRLQAVARMLLAMVLKRRLIAAREREKAMRKATAKAKLDAMSFCMRERTAATTIQAVYRGWRSRRSALSYLARVVRAQAIVRGWGARFRPLLNPDLWGSGRQVTCTMSSGAIATIQYAWRRFVAKKTLGRLRARQMERSLASKQADAATRISAWWKTRIAAYQLMEARAAATLVQSVFRGFAAQRRFTALKVIGAWFIRCRIEKRFAKASFEERIAALRICTFLSMVPARMHFKRCHAAAILMQSAMRGYLVCARQERQYGAALAIQEVARRFIFRSRLEKARVGRKLAAAAKVSALAALVKMQAKVRGMLSRAQTKAVVSRVVGSVTKLQAAVRGSIGRKTASAIKSGVRSPPNGIPLPSRLVFDDPASVHKVSVAQMVQEEVAVRNERTRKLRELPPVPISSLLMTSSIYAISSESAAMSSGRGTASFAMEEAVLSSPHSKAYASNLAAKKQAQFEQALLQSSQHVSAVMVQAWWKLHRASRDRMKKAKAMLAETKSQVALSTSSAMRSAISESRKQVNALILQSFFKGKMMTIRQRKRYLHMRGAAMYLQAKFRGCLARRYASSLRMARATSTEAVTHHPSDMSLYGPDASLLMNGSVDMSTVDVLAGMAAATPAGAVHEKNFVPPRATPRSTGSKRASAYAAARAIAEREANAIVLQATARTFLARRAFQAEFRARACQSARKRASGAAIVAWMRSARRQARTALLRVCVLTFLEMHKRKARAAAQQVADIALARSAMKAMHARASLTRAVCHEAAMLGAARAAARAVHRAAAQEAAGEATGTWAARATQRGIVRQAARGSAMLASMHMRAGTRQSSSTPRAMHPPRKEAALQASKAGVMALAARYATGRAAHITSERAMARSVRKAQYDAARIVQRASRVFLARLRMRLVQGCVLVLQSWARMVLAKAKRVSMAAEAQADAAECDADLELQAGSIMQSAREATEAALLRGASPSLTRARDLSPHARVGCIVTTEDVQFHSPNYGPGADGGPVSTRLALHAFISALSPASTVSASAGGRTPFGYEQVEDEREMHAIYTLAACTVQKKWRAHRVGKSPSTAIWKSFLAAMRKCAGHMKGAVLRMRQKRFVPLHPVVHVLMRLRIANRDRAKGITSTLGAITAKALSALAATRSLSEVMEACTQLEAATRWSPACAKAFVAVNAASTLYAVIRACGRSSAHVQLIRRALIVLHNVSTMHTGETVSGRTLARMLCTGDAVEVLMDLLSTHKDALQVVRPALDVLLAVLGAHPERRSKLVMAVTPIALLRELRGVYAKKAALVAAAAGGPAGPKESSAEIARSIAGIEAGREGFSLAGTVREFDRLLTLISGPAVVVAAGGMAVQVQQAAAAAAALARAPFISSVSAHAVALRSPASRVPQVPPASGVSAGGTPQRTAASGHAGGLMPRRLNIPSVTSPLGKSSTVQHNAKPLASKVFRPA